MKVVTFSLGENEIQKLDEAKKNTGLSKSVIVRQAIQKWEFNSWDSEHKDGNNKNDSENN